MLQIDIYVGYKVNVNGISQRRGRQGLAEMSLPKAEVIISSVTEAQVLLKLTKGNGLEEPDIPNCSGSQNSEPPDKTQFSPSTQVKMAQLLILVLRQPDTILSKGSRYANVVLLLLL